MKIGINKIILSMWAIANLAVSLPASAAWSVSGVNTFNLPNKPLSSMILDVTNWLVGFIIILSFLVIVYATVNPAGLDDEGATNKKMITYGVMGLVFAGLSWVIIYTVVNIVLT